MELRLDLAAGFSHSPRKFQPLEQGLRGK